MSKFSEQYHALWKRISSSETAAQQAVGGDFDVVGMIEFQLLKMLGVQPEHSIVDVGCGSGRLSSQLAPWLKARYIGTDIMQVLLDHAAKLCQRPDWNFIKTDGHEIPTTDSSADFVLFFSVITHITHEDSFRYLAEAKRVLKPGGQIICSFLEFAIRSHWAIFSMDLKDTNGEKVLNQFISRDALNAFAFNLGLEVVRYIDGDSNCIPIEQQLTWENGVVMSEYANLGQSVCVLRKPLVEIALPS